MRKLLLWIAVTGTIAAVIEPKLKDHRITSASHSTQVKTVKSNLNPEQTQKVCLAAIATMFSKPLKIVHVTHIAYDIVYLQYIREEDNSLWQYKCYLEGPRVIWGSVGNDTSGRWRTSKYDPIVTWAIEGNKLTIKDRISETSENVRTFSF
ncbi:hypothetical protein [Pseudoalteromonas rubra]|uniref:hypothetical protein n=1 Tax=Pseudoalteromonas rubra TaxID=43658 RepID=UPI0006985CBF|nr:hypothetical protein [Pseudoalteromonas rubra]